MSRGDVMFNKRLRSTRMARKYTQQVMADYVGVTLRTYQKYEQGTVEPSFYSLVLIADKLDVSTDYLLCRDSFLACHEAYADE